MGATILTQEREAVFQFKASFAPCTILQLYRYDLDELDKQLTQTIQRAPQFFAGSPVIIDLEKVKTLGSLQFPKIKQILLNHGLIPVGVRGGSEDQHIAAATVDLPMVSVGKTVHTEEKKPKKDEASFSVQSKLITHPIRSGMQVYAKDSDLIILAPVSVGAELLADGNIHVYGPLRGRALAGVKGNTRARIFCRQLDAELVSIAGYYLIKEDMQNIPNGFTIQIYLDKEQVKVEVV